MERLVEPAYVGSADQVMTQNPQPRVTNQTAINKLTHHHGILKTRFAATIIKEMTGDYQDIPMILIQLVPTLTIEG